MLHYKTQSEGIEERFLQPCFLQIQTDIYTYILLGVLFSNWYMSQIKQEVVVIWITFLQSAYPDKGFSYKATENYMELKGRAVWSKDQNGGHV